MKEGSWLDLKCLLLTGLERRNISPNNNKKKPLSESQGGFADSTRAEREPCESAGSQSATEIKANSR